MSTACALKSADGKCQGMYSGFGCIEDKCKDPAAGFAQDSCVHMSANGYCEKYRKFYCLGEIGCQAFERE